MKKQQFAGCKKDSSHWGMKIRVHTRGESGVVGRGLRWKGLRVEEESRLFRPIPGSRLYELRFNGREKGPVEKGGKLVKVYVIVATSQRKGGWVKGWFGGWGSEGNVCFQHVRPIASLTAQARSLSLRLYFREDTGESEVKERSRK